MVKTETPDNKQEKMGSDSKSKTIEWKWIALAVLIIQNSGLALFMRYSRISAPVENMYITSTAVVTSEFIKLVLSTLLSLQNDCNMSVTEFQKMIKKEFVEGWRDFLKLFVPSGLYVIQNNLQYIAASNLPADLFQVLCQMKIITTAFFSVTMLSRKLSFMQWTSIFMLATGLAIVQLSQSSDHTQTQTANLVGVVCVLCSSLTSGFAGVYFEKVLKSTSSSIWLRNIQMALIGLGISAIGCVANDLEAIHRDGFFRGYNGVVWIVIMLSAGGGLVVAIVVKYADNVLKGFATSASIVLSCIASYLVLGDSRLNFVFVSGTCMVCAAAFGFSFFPPKNTSSGRAADKENGSTESDSTELGGSGGASSKD